MQLRLAKWLQTFRCLGEGVVESIFRAWVLWGPEAVMKGLLLVHGPRYHFAQSMMLQDRDGSTRTDILPSLC